MNKPKQYRHKEIVFTDHALQRIYERNISHMLDLSTFYKAKSVRYFPEKKAVMLKVGECIYVANFTRLFITIITAYREDKSYWKQYGTTQDLDEITQCFQIPDNRN